MRKILIAVICLMLAASAAARAGSGCPAYYGKHGTAKYIGGRTIVISIFADDAATSWDFPLSGSRQRMYRDIRERMGIGLSWLEEQVRRYGEEAEFIWDFERFGGAGGLCRFAAFEEDLIGGGWDSYQAVCRYIERNIDTGRLMDEYGADNVVYAVHLNAPNRPDLRSFTFFDHSRYVESDEVYYEIAFFVPYGHGRENTPAVYAHEILHCFGAMDLYTAGDYVTRAYVDHLESTGAFDLMNRCYYSAYDRVTTGFLDVDAWFTGLVDSCADARDYGLGPSTFEKWGR